MALKVDYIAVSPTDVSNEYTNLSNTPTDGTVALDIIGGTAQFQGAPGVGDFGVVDSTKVSWGVRYNLNGQIATDSTLRAMYNK